MIITHANYEKLAVFREAHTALPAGFVKDTQHPDGSRTTFFTHATAEDFQKVVDQTLISLSKKRHLEVYDLDNTGPAPVLTLADSDDGTKAALEAAETALTKASSKSKDTKVTVVWGLHQSEYFPARGSGATGTQHFTVRVVGGGADWHFYVDTAFKTILWMSQSATRFIHVAND